MIPREDKIAGKAVANRKIPEPDSGYLAFPSGFGIEPVRACRIHNRELRGLARFLVQELELLCEGQQQRWRLMRYFPLNFIGVALCLYSVLTVSWQLAVLIVVILAAANSAMSKACTDFGKMLLNNKYARKPLSTMLMRKRIRAIKKLWNEPINFARIRGGVNEASIDRDYRLKRAKQLREERKASKRSTSNPSSIDLAKYPNVTRLFG